MSLLDPIPGIVASALAPIFKPAQLIPPGVATSDGQGGETYAEGAPVPCLALGVDYNDAIRSLANGAIEINDRKLIIVRATLPIGTNPKRGWKVSAAIDGAEATEWLIVGPLKADPAGATFEAQLRPV